MSLTFADIPGWNFNVEEVSANVYKVTAISSRGQRVEAKGVDPDELLKEARTRVIALSQR